MSNGSARREGESLTASQRQRLNALAERMKKAKGKELDAIVAEVDKVIGLDALKDRDEEAEKEAQRRWRGGSEDF